MPLEAPVTSATGRGVVVSISRAFHMCPARNRPASSRFSARDRRRLLRIHMPVPRMPRLAGLLLLASAASLAAVLLRNLGVVALGSAWDKAYNAAELLAIAACALRAARGSGAERAAWAVLALGLLGYAAGDIYWSVALEGLDAPPYPS